MGIYCLGKEFTKGKPKRAYSVEFKREAVRLARISGKSISEIARELGLSYESVRHWIKRSEIDSGVRQGLRTDEREELRRLRRENQVLQQEREILKKAPAFFARKARYTECLQVH